MKQNKTFGPSENYSNNALVGEDAFGDKDFAYEWGFATSVDLLLVLSLSHQYLEDVETGKPINILKDTLIYPILFCARHHIELHLKMHINRVSKLRGGSVGLGMNTHNLNDLYKILHDLSKSTDERLLPYVDALYEFVADYGAIDETGQTFRYAQDNEKNAHLPGEHLIDLGVVQARWRAMRDAMETLSIFVNDVLADEYATGTYTREFCRVELFELASALPPYHSWSGVGNEHFQKLKKEWLEKKGIGGRAFTEAINKIKTNHCLSALIGVEIPLDEISIDLIERLLAIRKGASVTELETMEWHAVSAVFECSSHIYYAEDYFVMVSAARADENRYIDPHHVLRKICWNPKRFSTGLRNLGQLTLLARFEALEESFFISRDTPKDMSEFTFGD
ncbi:hypothetical protein PSH70_10865 [Pseudomonas fluorescens]|uniref:hypothetical protein n=1 Tax=Pseudomonas fluorescens TaxID=294 RepID=UPI002739CAD4|nr:hypothetical protein [Pseudomonas fluorescens]WLH75940.1 hypothetical protein PSH70_10865 [Pseudomonas fluorescens]